MVFEIARPDAQKCQMDIAANVAMLIVVNSIPVRPGKDWGRMGSLPGRSASHEVSSAPTGPILKGDFFSYGSDCFLGVYGVGWFLVCHGLTATKRKGKEETEKKTTLQMGKLMYSFKQKMNFQGM